MYQQRLEDHYVGQDDVMPQRLVFFNCTQTPCESVTDFETRIRKTSRGRISSALTDFETRIRSTAKKTSYAEMTNPLQELMRDRLFTGVYDKDLREILLRYYKEDGKNALHV